MNAWAAPINGLSTGLGTTKRDCCPGLLFSVEEAGRPRGKQAGGLHGRKATVSHQVLGGAWPQGFPWCSAHRY